MKKINLDLFLTFFKIGAFTFGGGWAMISLLEKDIVDKHKWLTKEEFVDLLAISQSLPGIIFFYAKFYHKVYYTLNFTGLTHIIK